MATTKASGKKAGDTKAAKGGAAKSGAAKSRKRDPGPSVKDKELYESLRDDGASKEKAARIANAAAAKGRSSVGKKGGKAEDYDDRTVDELRKRAKQLGLTGYSKLKKKDLIAKLRDH